VALRSKMECGQSGGKCYDGGVAAEKSVFVFRGRSVRLNGWIS
jgi:hypothetical protein